MNSALKSALFVYIVLGVSASLRSEETPPAPAKESEAVPQAQADVELADRHFDRGRELAKEKRYPEAIREYEAAFEIDKIHRRKDAAYDLENIGQSYYALRRYEEALKYCQEALPIRREVKDRAGEATTLHNIGVAYLSLSRYEEALKHYQEALPIRHEVKDRAGEATTLDNIGQAYFYLSRYEEALKYYQEALLIRREVKDRAGEEVKL